MTIHPVCGMEADGKKVAARQEYQGKRYYSCSLAARRNLLRPLRKVKSL